MIWERYFYCYTFVVFCQRFFSYNCCIPGLAFLHSPDCCFAYLKAIFSLSLVNCTCFLLWKHGHLKLMKMIICINYYITINSTSLHLIHVNHSVNYWLCFTSQFYHTHIHTLFVLCDNVLIVMQIFLPFCHCAAGGLEFLTSSFSLCKPLESKYDLEDLMNWLVDIYGNLAMVDYPYPASFLEPLPAWPVKVWNQSHCYLY